MAKSNLRTSLSIASPPEAVWNVLSDFHHVEKWAPVFARTEKIGKRTEGVGTARRCYFRYLGSIEEVVIEWESGARLGYRVSAVGPFRSATSRWELEPTADGGTQVTLNLEYSTRYGRLGQILDTLFLRRAVQQNLPGAVKRLRRGVLRQLERAA